MILNEIQDCFVGDLQASKIYVGEKLIWPSLQILTTGLSLHLNAERGITLSNPSLSTVQTWEDLSINNNDAFSVSNNEPTLTKSAPNNKNSIKFVSSPNRQFLDINSSFNLKNSTGFISIKSNSATSYDRILSFMTDDPENRYDFNNNDGLSVNLNIIDFRKFQIESSSNRSFITGSPIFDWSVLSYRINSNGDILTYFNGNSGLSATNSSMANTNSGNLRIGSSGRFNNALESLANAEIFEIALYNTYLSDQDFSYMQQYMNNSVNL